MADFHIKKCPFCGSKDNCNPSVNFYKASNSNHAHHTISCSYCGTEPNFFAHSEAQAIEAWNRRADQEPDIIEKRIKNLADRVYHLEEIQGLK
jgi:Lar family restriction alleviation protein